MRLERVLGTNGIFVITESGMKNPIGNKFFSPGELVCVDDNVVYGNENKVHSFTYTSNPMIEVFLSFEQEKTLDWNTFKYTCNKRTVKIHSINFDSDFEILGEVEAVGDFADYEKNSSNTDFLYSSNKIFIAENYWYGLKVREYGNDILEFQINSDMGEVFNCTELYVDDNENINTATCLASSNIYENVSVQKAVIQRYINANKNIVKDYSSDVDELIMARYNQLISVLPKVIKVLSGTAFTITKLRSIDSNGNPNWEFISDVVEFINPGTLDVLETQESSRFPGAGNFVPHCADVWGGAFVKGESRIEISKEITSFRINTNSLDDNIAGNRMFNGCVFTWDTTLNLYKTHKNGYDYYILNYSYELKAVWSVDRFGFSIFGEVGIIVGENIKKIYYDDSEFKFDYKSTFWEKKDEIFLNDINSNISNVNETNLELKFKIKDSGWFLVGFTKDEDWHISDCYLTDNNIKIDCNADFYGGVDLCNVIDGSDYVLFRLRDTRDTVIYYNKITGETKRKTVDDYNLKLSNKIKININDYKKMLTTLLAK